MIADCTDYEYTLSGHFVPGIMGALFSFIDKSFSALGTGFVGIALAIAGYSKVFPQVEDQLTPQLKFLLHNSDNRLDCDNIYNEIL